MKNSKIASLGLAFLLATPVLAKTPITISAPQTAKPGSNITVSVKAPKGAKCKIEAQDIGFTQGMNLGDKTAKNGRASWKFQIPKDFKANELPIIVTVDNNGVIDKAVKAITIGSGGEKSKKAK
jgi:hypothetical protein